MRTPTSTGWDISRHALDVIDGCATPDELARTIDIHPDWVRSLTDFLVWTGELMWDEWDRRYWTTSLRLPHPPAQ